MDIRLVKFLMRHGNNLRSIHLDQPVRREIYWQFLAYYICTQCANASCITTSSDDTSFHSKSDCTTETDRLNYDAWRESIQDSENWWTHW